MPRRASRHKVQYFEIFGNRAIYADGWFAGTVHRAPWEMKPRAALLDDKWELYDTRSDFSLANDLAAKNPAKLKELQDLFMKEAVKYRVLPIDDRIVERVNAKLVGRPDLMGDRTSLTLHAGMKGMSENVFLNIKNRSLTITADVEIPQGGAERRDPRAGRRLRRLEPLPEGRQADLHVQLPGPPAVQRRRVTGRSRGQGDDPLRLRLRRRRPRPRAASGTIFVNDKKVAEGRIERTQPMIFSADETADVGEDDATPVTEDYKAYDNKFTGKILKVTVDVKPMGEGEKAAASKARAEDPQRSWRRRSDAPSRKESAQALSCRTVAEEWACVPRREDDE